MTTFSTCRGNAICKRWQFDCSLSSWDACFLTWLLRLALSKLCWAERHFYLIPCLRKKGFDFFLIRYVSCGFVICGLYCGHIQFLCVEFLETFLIKDGWWILSIIYILYIYIYITDGWWIISMYIYQDLYRYRAMDLIYIEISMIYIISIDIYIYIN